MTKITFVRSAVTVLLTICACAQSYAGGGASAPPPKSTSEGSAYAVLQEQEGPNKAIAIDGFYSVLVAPVIAAAGETKEEFKRLLTSPQDGSSPAVQTERLNSDECVGYSNATYVLSTDPLHQRIIETYNSFGGTLVSGLSYKAILDRVAILNAQIREKLGFENAIELSGPVDFLALSIAQQKTPWESTFNDEDVYWTPKNGDFKRVPGTLGEANVSRVQALNGVPVDHVHMSNGVIASIAFLDEIEAKDTDIGEWLAESYFTAERTKNSQKLRIHLPNLDIEKEVDFENLDKFQFLFDTAKAELLFHTTGTPCVLTDAKQKLKLTLSKDGLDAKAVTYAGAVVKALSGPKVDVSYDRPFVVVFSYLSKDGKSLYPTFAAIVTDPSVTPSPSPSMSQSM